MKTVTNLETSIGEDTVNTTEDDFDDDIEGVEAFGEFDDWEDSRAPRSRRSKLSRRRIELLKEKRWLQEQLRDELSDGLWDEVKDMQPIRLRAKTHRPRFG